MHLFTRSIGKMGTSPHRCLRRVSSICASTFYSAQTPFRSQLQASLHSVAAKQLQFGQAVHETHPHLLEPGEITPGITAIEYAARRADLISRLPQEGNDVVAILAAADLRYRSGAVFYPYRQESNFLYLTGFNEPESVAVIRKTSSRARPNQYHFHLFVRAKDPKAEQWSGPWSGLDAARDVFNADAVSDIADLHRLLPSMLRKNDSVFLNEETSNTSLTGQIKAILESSVTSKKVRAVQKPLNSLRVVKSQAEVANMRRAGRLSGQVITAAMRRSWTSEKELADYLGYDFSRQGCDGPAYVPVVAGGPRGSMIHYTLNNALLNEEELVLVDAGGEYGTYITDISRTWPVRGRFAPAQRDLYEAVLKVQRKVLTMCTRRADLTLDKLHQITEDGLKQELLNLGFDMSGDAINVLFPHHVGHYIGLDVHDVPGYARSMPLTVGTCITVEPGIYVPDDERWPKHFRGMAIRIEDSVCVDDDSPYVLTTEAVKEVSDIEALRD